MKKHFPTILLVLILITGLSLLLYPSFSDWWNAQRQSRAITGYAEAVAVMDQDRYAEIWDTAWDYNQSLLDRPNSFVLSEERQAEYESLLNIDGYGIMGYIEIPAINVALPIYHGTDETVLQVAVGHLEWSSLPVGNGSSHCVLSGHRGLPSAKLFTDLDDLVVGDVFMLRVLDEVLTYQVDQILIVDPTEKDALLIKEGQDLCTLVTCTPYGINTHRLLVRGHRIENQEEATQVVVTANAVQIEPEIVAPILALPLLLLVIIVWAWPTKKKK